MSKPSPTRRDVLRDAGLSLAGAAFLPSVLTGSRPKLGRWRIDDALRVGIVGPGRRGSNLMARMGYPSELANATDQTISGVELVAVCDTFLGNLRTASDAVSKVHDRPTEYRDYRLMLEREDLDAVVVATPDFSHAPIAQAAVEAGCDVYVEKCAANTADQLRSLEAAVAKHGRIVQVGYQLRENELYRQAKAIVERGWIGEVRLARMEVHRHGSNGALRHPLLEYGPAPERADVEWELFLAGIAPEREYDAERYFEWRKFWDYGNGVCGDNQSHSVDAIEFVVGLGLPASATASGGVYHWGGARETPDVLSANVEYPDAGISVNYMQTDSNSFGVPGTWLYGSEGTMHVSWELEVYPDRFSERYADSLEEGKLDPRRPMIHLKDPAAAKAMEGKASELWLAGRGAGGTTRSDGTFDTTRLHLENFFTSVRERSTPTAPLEVARTSTIAAIMSAESYRTGRRVTLEDVGFAPEPTGG
ncbi:Gfo/Idh/MocA family protein [Engelhardtia mirabilis]|uniref:Inositol 2-dehydrogenase n=1 Tax=Engelhardtia mirabilis TaxID=2528011 RepID=A0A518BE06_9BACT|nr:Inositol 2-dehydrogenase [Planctomycetes bacterium Pla133]QDU99522.1 Inositol 2-dehydrogenase [Planctomycetes bacterium Pla86]